MSAVIGVAWKRRRTSKPATIVSKSVLLSSRVVVGVGKCMDAPIRVRPSVVTCRNRTYAVTRLQGPFSRAARITALIAANAACVLALVATLSNVGRKVDVDDLVDVA